MKNTEKTMDQIVALCKGRGFVFPGSEIYGGLANSWDYGPLGVELKNNVKRAWWKKFVQENPYNVGLDAAILMNPEVWVASGHVSTFNDPLIDCKACKMRHRADKLIEGWCAENGRDDVNVEAMTNEELVAFIRDNGVTCPGCGKADFTDIRKFNLMFKTHQGVTEDSSTEVYLRPETAQGIFVNFPAIQRTTRKKLPFGVCQVGKSFRNEITPGNFIFRIREFEQMELEFFCQPGTDLEWFQYWRELLPQVAGGSGHEGGEPPPARPRARGAGLLLQGHHRLRVHVPLRLGRAVGRGRPHRLRPQAAPGALRPGSDLLRPGEERALYPLCHRALPGRGPHDPGLPGATPTTRRSWARTRTTTTSAPSCASTRPSPPSSAPCCPSPRSSPTKAREIQARAVQGLHGGL